MWSHSQSERERGFGAHHKGRARSVQRETRRGGCIKFVVGGDSARASEQPRRRHSVRDLIIMCVLYTVKRGERERRERKAAVT